MIKISEGFMFFLPPRLVCEDLDVIDILIKSQDRCAEQLLRLGYDRLSNIVDRNNSVSFSEEIKDVSRIIDCAQEIKRQVIEIEDALARIADEEEKEHRLKADHFVKTTDEEPQ